MQLSFFDHAMKYQGGKKSMKFLNEMKEIILIDKNVYKPNKGKTGRPLIPSKILIGSLFLQNWYGLSDPMTQELIHDRISFRKFLDIRDEDTIPDETTICKFRNKLIKEELLGDIFEEVKKMMESKRLILNERTLIDATLIHSSEPIDALTQDKAIFADSDYMCRERSEEILLGCKKQGLETDKRETDIANISKI